jgi:hypothetical protein
MAESETKVEGWGFPGASRKAHYFVGWESLCGRWLYQGPLTPNQSDAKSPDDCAACRRKLEQAQQKAEPSRG